MIDDTRWTGAGEIATSINTVVASATIAGHPVVLHEGTPLVGWQRVVAEGHDVHWSSPASLMAWAAARPAADVAVVDVTARTMEILIRDGDRVVTMLVVGNVLGDVDIFPIDIPLWGGNAVTVERVLKFWMRTAEAAYGQDYWRVHPALLLVEAEQEPERRRLDAFQVKTVNAKVDGRQREELSGVAIDSQLLALVSRMVAIDSAVDDDAVNAAIAFLSLDMVRFQKARFNQEQPAPWYWGPQNPACGAGDTRRRCDQMRGDDQGDFNHVDPSDPFRKISVTWQASGYEDALSVAGVNSFLGLPVPRCTSVEHNLKEAEQGLRDVTGAFDARIPVSVDVVSWKGGGIDCSTRTVILELASTNADFRHGGAS